MEDPACLPLCDLTHRRPELPAKHQSVEKLCLVLSRLLSLGNIEVLFVRAQSVLHQHRVLLLCPGVESLFKSLSNVKG